MVKKERIIISIVMPCLNEEKTIGKCIDQAQKAVRKLGYSYEIIVVDNGSTDRSSYIAQQKRVTVMREKIKGYGAACDTGIKSAKGEYIIMGDCDGTYDFRDIERLINKLEDGKALVLGSRFTGTIQKGAMPWANRYIGNPLLTSILNIFYGTHISDAHTGLRAFRKSTYQTFHMKSRGMEFASEMLIKAIYHRIHIEEIPIRYSKRLGQSKLSRVSDAWRHIQCILLYSPTYTFILPGFVLFLLGITISIFLLPHGQRILGFFIDIHTMTVGIFFANLGLQLLLLGMFARSYTQYILGLPSGPLARFLLSHFQFPRLLRIGLFLFLGGTAILGFITVEWALSDFHSLYKIREFIFGAGFSMLGIQLLFSSFFLELLKEQQ